MKKKNHLQDLETKLEQSFDRWETLYKSGGNDPFWSDGCNLNLVRNHICYYKEEIEQTFEINDYPSIYYRETPQKVPEDYMARSEEIRMNANKSIQIYKDDKNYKFLLSRVNRLHPKDVKATCIQNVINYTKGLEQAIASDDLITMRRYENPDNYTKAFLECAEKVKSLKPKENKQISIFDMLSDTQMDESDEYENKSQGMNLGM